MIFKMMAVFDAKAVTYGVPFFSQNRAVGVRSFKALSNDPGSMVSKSPEDFSLFELGEFDDTSAAFALHDQPQFITNALSQREVA